MNLSLYQVLSTPFFQELNFSKLKITKKKTIRIAPLQEKIFSEENILKLCKSTEAYSFHLNEKFLTHSLIEILNTNRLRTIPYTINNEKRIEQLAKWGVTGIITDEPEIMWTVLRKLKISE